jgi:hypothetical protein
MISTQPEMSNNFTGGGAMSLILSSRSSSRTRFFFVHVVHSRPLLIPSCGFSVEGGLLSRGCLRLKMLILFVFIHNGVY